MKIKGYDLGLKNIVSFIGGNRFLDKNDRFVLDLKAENWHNIQKNLDLEVSRNRNELLKSLFLEYLDTDIHSKSNLVRSIDEILDHKSFHLFRDSITLPLLLKELYFNQNQSEQRTISKWIDRMIHHRSFIPSPLVGEFILRGVISLSEDDWRLIKIKKWLQILISYADLNASMEKYGFFTDLVEVFLRAKGTIKVTLSELFEKLLQSQTFKPSMNGNSISVKLLNNLHHANSDDKGTITEILNKIFLHPMFSPSNGDNILLMDLLENYNIQSSHRNQISSWIDIILAHPQFKPSSGNNRILRRLSLEFELVPLWKSTNVRRWIQSVLSNRAFNHSSFISDIYMESENRLKKMIMEGWIKQLDGMNPYYDFPSDEIISLNLRHPKIKID